MTNIQSNTIIDNTDSNSDVIHIHAQSNISIENQYKDIGRQLTKIFYKKNPTEDFKALLNGKLVKIYLPQIEKKCIHNIITLRRNIIDIALQAKVHGIQIEIYQL